MVNFPELLCTLNFFFTKKANIAGIRYSYAFFPTALPNTCGFLLIALNVWSVVTWHLICELNDYSTST